MSACVKAGQQKETNAPGNHQTGSSAALLTLSSTPESYIPSPPSWVLFLSAASPSALCVLASFELAARFAATHSVGVRTTILPSISNDPERTRASISMSLMWARVMEIVGRMSMPRG